MDQTNPLTLRFKKTGSAEHEVTHVHAVHKTFKVKVKVKEKHFHTHSWHKKRTGLLIAGEIRPGTEIVITTLTRTNDYGVKP